MKASITRSLEILNDIFGSNNQDLIDSAIRFLKEEEEREEQEEQKKDAVLILEDVLTELEDKKRGEQEQEQEFDH